MMEWTNEVTLRFFDIYENKPINWAPSHKLHKNRNEVHDARKCIQSELSLEVSIDELKKKKYSLMATFRNSKSKLKSSSKSGAGSNDVYRPHWFAFANMAEFLMNHDCQKKTMNSEIIESEENGNGSQYNQFSESEHLETNDHDTTDVTVISEEKPLNAPATKKKKVQARDDIIYDRVENAYNMLKKQSMPKATTERSEYAIYAELLAKRLETMEPSERDYVMHAIDNVMYEAKKRFDRNRYTNIGPSTQPSSETSHFTTPSPLSEASHISSHHSNIQYSNPLSVETYAKDPNAKEFYEHFL